MFSSKFHDKAFWIQQHWFQMVINTWYLSKNKLDKKIHCSKTVLSVECKEEAYSMDDEEHQHLLPDCTMQSGQPESTLYLFLVKILPPFIFTLKPCLNTYFVNILTVFLYLTSRTQNACLKQIIIFSHPSVVVIFWQISHNASFTKTGTWLIVNIFKNSVSSFSVWKWMN